MRKTALRRVSKKRAKEARVYTKLRKEFLLDNPSCEFPECWDWATDIHHSAGRGKNYLNTSTWMGLCRKHHQYVENNKRWSRENGYITYR